VKLLNTAMEKEPVLAQNLVQPSTKWKKLSRLKSMVAPRVPTMANLTNRLASFWGMGKRLSSRSTYCARGEE